jgi:hypothetical protein
VLDGDFCSQDSGVASEEPVPITVARNRKRRGAAGSIGFGAKSVAQDRRDTERGKIVAAYEPNLDGLLVLDAAARNDYLSFGQLAIGREDAGEYVVCDRAGSEIPRRLEDGALRIRCHRRGRVHRGS